MSTIQWIVNIRRKHLAGYAPFGREKVGQAMAYHRTLPCYGPTPLVRLRSLAQNLGVSEVYVKDESDRFGLQSFKVLGSSYAIARQLAPAGKAPPPFEQLKRAIDVADRRTFVTATAGNHGRGVAWAARQLGQEAVVFLPKGASPHRREHLLALGARAEITPFSYDEAVRSAADIAERRGWVLIQDTAWDGYVEVPSQIMQGYLTILGECMRQWQAHAPPTHVFLQAGVGSFAAAMAAGIRQLLGESVAIVVVEPASAGCIFQSASSIDGEATPARGDLATVMAGLACGVPNPVAWGILKSAADVFVVCGDEVAVAGMRRLAVPEGGDMRIISGESGALPTGMMARLCKDSNLAPVRERLNLTAASRLFCVSTEGDTDPLSYRRHVAPV